MKGTRRMPWHLSAKKDAVSCEKLRGGASSPRSEGIRMGQPLRRRQETCLDRGEAGEVKHLSSRI